MAIIVKGGEPKTINVDDGLHVGVIRSVEIREVEGKEYKYLDLYLALEDAEGVELKVGYALPKPSVGLNSKQDLGKLVERMTKQSIVPDKDYDLEGILKGTRVQFVTLQNEKGYSEVTKESVRPVFEAKKKEGEGGAVSPSSN